MRRRKSMLKDLDQDIRDHIERETQDPSSFWRSVWALIRPFLAW